MPPSSDPSVPPALPPGAGDVTTPGTPLCFPPDWAFVIQLQAGTPFAATLLCGRIEHVQTGHAGLFASLEEARQFMQRVMAAVPGAVP